MSNLVNESLKEFKYSSEYFAGLISDLYENSKNVESKTIRFDLVVRDRYTFPPGIKTGGEELRVIMEDTDVGFEPTLPDAAEQVQSFLSHHNNLVFHNPQPRSVQMFLPENPMDLYREIMFSSYLKYAIVEDCFLERYFRHHDPFFTFLRGLKSKNTPEINFYLRNHTFVAAVQW